MAVWCFVCDAPIDGSRGRAVCPRCGRPGTVVEDAVEERSRPSPFAPLRRVPNRVWIVVAVTLVVALFALMQSGFRLE